MTLINWIIVACVTVWHPFHVSVCDIEYKPQIQALQVAQRMFADDLENALNKNYGTDLMLNEEATAALRDSLIREYVMAHLLIRADGRTLAGHYLGYEFEEDGIWCYIEYANVPPFTSLEVKSTILLEMFDDQDNIIHFKWGEYEKSIKLDNNKKWGLFAISG